MFKLSQNYQYSIYKNLALFVILFFIYLLASCTSDDVSQTNNNNKNISNKQKNSLVVENRFYGKFFKFKYPVTIPDFPLNRDKLHVIEIFSHACKHCAATDTEMQKWLAKAEVRKNVDVHYMPVSITPSFVDVGRLYLVLKKLGVADYYYNKIYKIYHEEKVDLSDTNAIASYFTNLLNNDVKIGKIKLKQQLTVEYFLQELQSEEVSNKLLYYNKIIIDAKIKSTPSFIVNGKYMFDGRMVTSYADFISILDGMLQEYSIGKL